MLWSNTRTTSTPNSGQHLENSLGHPVTQLMQILLDSLRLDQFGDSVAQKGPRHPHLFRVLTPWQGKWKADVWRPRNRWKTGHNTIQKGLILPFSAWVWLLTVQHLFPPLRGTFLSVTNSLMARQMVAPFSRVAARMNRIRLRTKPSALHWADTELLNFDNLCMVRWPTAPCQQKNRIFE